jgi:hypothetical protein
MKKMIRRISINDNSECIIICKDNSFYKHKRIINGQIFETFSWVLNNSIIHQQNYYIEKNKIIYLDHGIKKSVINPNGIEYTVEKIKDKENYMKYVL